MNCLLIFANATTILSMNILQQLAQYEMTYEYNLTDAQAGAAVAGFAGHLCSLCLYLYWQYMRSMHSC